MIVGPRIAKYISAAKMLRFCDICLYVCPSVTHLTYVSFTL